jgi:hypothetical protein
MPAYPLSPAEKSPQLLNYAIQQIFQGRVNCTGTVTLRTGFATTVLNVPTAGVGTFMFFESMTANAAAERASGNFYYDPITVARTVTIHHTNSGTTGRTFSWMNFG